MAVVPLADLQPLARELAGARHDGYSERALARGYEEYLARRRVPLAGFRLRAAGRDLPSFYALLTGPAPPRGPLELILDDPPGPGPAWDFLRPFAGIVFAEDGSAEIRGPDDGPPTRAIVRVLLREHYLSRSRTEEDRAAAGGSRITLPTLLRSLPDGVAACRARALLPFCVAVLAYLPEERIIYELDLLRSLLLADPRAGRLPIGRRVHRSARIGWHVDQWTGRGEVPLLAARSLPAIVESQGLAAVEAAHIFGGVRELMDSALQGLAARGVVAFDRRTGVYRHRLDAFQPSTPSAHGPYVPSENPNPALRTSVQELIAAADARATCPLCGAPIGGDHRGLLCAKCAAEVDLG